MMHSCAQSISNRHAFTETLAMVQERLKGEEIDFRIIGSVATAAYTDSPLDFNRIDALAPAGRIPDIDIIAPVETLPWLRAYRDQLLRTAFPVGLGITAASTIDFRPDETYSYAQYGNLRVGLSSGLFESVQRTFSGVSITTVYPRTLFHTYVTVGGQLRSKDIGKARQLQRLALPGQPAEEAYGGFHTFIRSRRQGIPYISRPR